MAFINAHVNVFEDVGIEGVEIKEFREKLQVLQKNVVELSNSDYGSLPEKEVESKIGEILQTTVFPQKVSEMLTMHIYELWKKGIA